MIECNKLDLTLILKPINTLVKPGASDDWLNNDDPSLLRGFSHFQANNPELGSVIEKISAVNNNKPKTYQVEYIQIKQQLDNFLLFAESQWLCLENGDVIVTGGTALEVKIQKKQVVMNPDPNLAAVELPANSSEDFWEIPSKRLDASVITVQNIMQDPLTFLFGTATPSTADSMSTLIPQTSGMGSMPYDPVAILQSPMPMLVSRAGEFQQIASLSSKNMEITRNSPGAGNILQELGIGETSSSQSTIYQSGYFAKKSLAEQSPADNLDEFLSDPLQETYIQKY